MPATNHNDLVTHTILVGSSPRLTVADALPQTAHVVEIQVEGELNKIPTATVTLRDGNPYEQDFALSSSGLLEPGKFIEVKLGYNGHETTVFKGLITAISHQIQESRSLLVATCKHETVKMTVARHSRHYAEVKDSEIAEQLLSENGLTDFEVESTPVVHEQLLQHQITDWDFMMTRLDGNGLYYTVEAGKIVIRKPDTSRAPVTTLTYGNNILSFDAALDARVQSTGVISYAWDPTAQEVTETDGTASDEELAAILDESVEIRLPGAVDRQSLQLLADAKRNRQSLSQIKGRVRCPGNGDIVPGSFITLDGVGRRFNGNVFVSAIHHDYAEGNWTTEATLGWDEAFFAEKIFPEHPVSFTAQYVATQGLHVGVVSDIVDPAGQGRVRVRLPLVGPSEEGLFARLATLDAGDNRGTFFMPEVGDEVIVGFLGDDPNYPVVLGMLHSSAKPAPWSQEEANDEKGYMSRSGIAITVHDGDKRISITTPGGRKLILDDTEGSCSLLDSDGNEVILDSSGITISTAKDLVLKAASSISLSAPQVELSADVSAKLSANGTLGVESSGITEIKGAMVKIN